MGVDRTGHVEFCASDNNAVISTLCNVNILIGIILIRGSLGTIPLGIRHGADDHKVFILNPDQPFLEPL